MTLIKKVGAILRNEKGEILIFEERLNDGKYHYTIPKGTFEKKRIHRSQKRGKEKYSKK